MGDGINTIVSQKLEAIKQGKNLYQTGHVTAVRDYIVEVSGMEQVAYFEKVLVGDGSEGYVDAISRSSVMVALTRKGGRIHIGDETVATGKEFRMEFSEESIGHVVDMFGEDKLMGQKFADTLSLPVETPAIPIMVRSTVNRPLLTGITGIDMLYPIGRGQRQLIIGDKKTGKSQIALDTIVNQKGKDMLCIYVAVGKTKKEVKDVYNQLMKHDAMGYTIIFAAFNDECAPVLEKTPYAAMTVAEHYMRQGKDVLVVIDDLKRHADVHREISLLSGKVPGRDAYPPDIFYAHARLLEKGCQHADGGSISILPICETKGGDITDYISTNIISITDGQIVLSAKNFEQGQKPAINYGLSVSRLGGAVQTREMKKQGSAVRRDLLSYLEQREIFELANMDEMSQEMRDSMARGSRILSNLKQNKFAVRTPETMLQLFEGMF